MFFPGYDAVVISHALAHQWTSYAAIISHALAYQWTSSAANQRSQVRSAPNVHTKMEQNYGQGGQVVLTLFHYPPSTFYSVLTKTLHPHLVFHHPCRHDGSWICRLTFITHQEAHAARHKRLYGVDIPILIIVFCKCSQAHRQSSIVIHLSRRRRSSLGRLSLLVHHVLVEPPGQTQQIPMSISRDAHDDSDDPFTKIVFCSRGSRQFLEAGRCTLECCVSMAPRVPRTSMDNGPASLHRKLALKPQSVS